MSLVAPMCYRNHAIKSVLDHFLNQIKTFKRKRNAETFFQRELLPYFTRKIQFYVQFLGLNFQGNDLNLKEQCHISRIFFFPFFLPFYKLLMDSV